MTDIEVLDPQETYDVLATRHGGRSNEMSDRLVASLLDVVDTGSSVYVTGLREPQINVIRTRMGRRDIKVSVTKVKRNGVTGHVIFAKTIQP